MKTSIHRKAAATSLVIALATGSALSIPAPGAAAATKGNIVIGFAQAFASNSWQQGNDAAFFAAAKKLKAEGKIANYIFEDANNSDATQVSQIQSMILKRVSVIVVDPVSASGENGAIAQAIHAGIPVLVFSDGPVTSTLPYEMNFRQQQGEIDLTKWTAEALHGKGNVLLIRGVAGTGGDADFYKGMLDGLKRYPGIKVVGSVYGDWNDSTAEAAVAKILPSLPTVNALITEGGEEYGPIQAFLSVGRPAPLVVGGNRGNFLHWWYTEHQKNGYSTISEDANPGIGAAAVYVGYDLATGVHVPKSMNFPWLRITQQSLRSFVKKVPFNGVAYTVPTQAWVDKNVVKTSGPLFMS